MTNTQHFEFDIVPIGTVLYEVKNDKVIEYVIKEFKVDMNNLGENYILYYTDKLCSFVQPLPGKFESASKINNWRHIDVLSTTREEAVERFLNNLGIKACVSLFFD